MISDFDSLVNLIFQYFRTNKSSLIDNCYLKYLIENVHPSVDLPAAINDGKRCYFRFLGRRQRIKNRIINFKHPYFITFKKRIIFIIDNSMEM